MPIYNLIEYSLNYSKTTGELWFYSKDEATNFNVDNADNIILNVLSIRLRYYEIQLQMEQMEF